MKSKYNYSPLFMLAVLFLLLNGCHKNDQSNQSEKPNFLFILVDDLGKEWISTCGADSVATPFIDQLAKNGLVFENAYSMPQCTPSRVTLLTGKYPYNHGWINHYDVPRWGHGARFDPARNTTFASILRDAGYKTCAAGKWQINDFRLEPEAMVNAGFDAYCMWTGGEGGNIETSKNRYWDPYIHTREGSKVYEGQFGPDIFTDFIIDFMAAHKEDPIMIYYPMVLTHGPLVATPLEPDAATKIEKHKAMTRYTDYLVNRLVDALDEQGIRDETYVIFTTDNGTASNIIGYRHGEAVRGGKTYLTENGVNAPFVVNKPGIPSAGEVSSALIDFTDLFPTFLELAEVEVSDSLDLDGKSFSALLKGEAEGATHRDWILAMGSYAGRIGEDGMIRNWYEFRDRTIRDKRFKVYIDTLRNIHRLFDLGNDPKEQNNIISSTETVHLDALKRFQAVLDQLPLRDQNPIYSPLDSSIYNVPPGELERRHRSDLNRSNMSPPVE